jgi:tungstate transport system substrate-binding protein
MKKLFYLMTVLLLLTLTGCQGEKELYIATTTSLDNSGLLVYLLPHFEEEYGIKVNVVAVGTGAALELGKEGEVEILLVHDLVREVQFVEDGFGTKRDNIMYNDFVILGPQPLQADTLETALLEIKNNYNFYSRGDNSGTHSKEVSLWEEIGLDPSTFGEFYNETGQGMGDTISMASLSGYYTLSDRGTYLSMKENIDLVVAYENYQELLNQYGVIKVDPALYNKTDKYADLFYDWILSREAQELIGEYRIYNEQLFFPNAE